MSATQTMPTATEIRDLIAESARHQLDSIKELLTSAGVDISALANAIGGGPAMLLSLRIAGDE